MVFACPFMCPFFFACSCCASFVLLASLKYVKSKISKKRYCNLVHLMTLHQLCWCTSKMQKVKRTGGFALLWNLCCTTKGCKKDCNDFLQPLVVQHVMIAQISLYLHPRCTEGAQKIMINVVDQDLRSTHKMHNMSKQNRRCKNTEANKTKRSVVKSKISKELILHAPLLLTCTTSGSLLYRRCITLWGTLLVMVALVKVHRQGDMQNQTKMIVYFFDQLRWSKEHYH